MLRRLLPLCCLLMLLPEPCPAQRSFRLLAGEKDAVGLAMAATLAGSWSDADRQFSVVATRDSVQSLVMLSLGQGDLAVVRARALATLRGGKATRGVLRRIRLVAAIDKAWLVTTDRQPEALIERLTGRLCDGLPALLRQHPALKGLTEQALQAAAADPPILLHAGARRAMQRRRRFALRTGSQGGTYDRLGRGIAAAARDVRLLPVQGSGSVASLIALSMGAAELALVQGDVLQALRERSDLAPLARVGRLVAALYLEEVHLVVRRELARGGVRDLVGRRVSLGPPGSGTALTAQRLLARHHIRLGHVTARYLPTTLALEQVMAGKLDACFVVAGRPYAPLARLPKTAAEKIALMPIRLANPGIYRQVSITADSYPWLAADVVTLGTPCLLVASPKAPDFLVRAVLDGIYGEAGRKQLREAHPKAVEATVAFSRDLLTSRREWFHPAARSWLAARRD